MFKIKIVSRAWFQVTVWLGMLNQKGTSELGIASSNQIVECEFRKHTEINDLDKIERFARGNMYIGKTKTNEYILQEKTTKILDK